MNSRAPARWLLAAVIAGYLTVGATYAMRTPLWQVPDEPAHYNYVAHVARTGRPPVIQPGDYPFDRLEELKADRFPAGVSVDGIEYEDHQPPAYYYLAASVERLVGGSIPRQVTAIRLLGVVLGLLTVLGAWRVGRLLVPDEPMIAVGAAGLTSFLPMQLTMTAAVNNDALANALGAWLLAVAAGFVAVTARSPAWLGWGGVRRYAVQAGLLLGLAFWTKLTLYPLAAAVAVGGLLGYRSLPGEFTSVGQSVVRRCAAGLAPLLVAGALILPWLLRNVAVYGGDALGLDAHEAVVVGQPLTPTWIAQFGLVEYVERLTTFTFRSFWGVFGWMGVFMEEWVYLGLAAVTAVMLTGALLALPAVRWRVAAVLVTGLAAVIGAFLIYNVSFVQHQGRYLLPAVAGFAALGSAGLFYAVSEGYRWLTSALFHEPAEDDSTGTLRSGEIGSETRRSAPPSLAIWLARLAVLGFVAGLAVLAYVSVGRYIVPGLTP